jgi:protoheme IX farnesyltransferase
MDRLRVDRHNNADKMKGAFGSDMKTTTFRRLTIATALGAYAAVLCSGTVRALGGDATSTSLLLDMLTRLAALLSGSFALATVYLGTMQLWSRRRFLLVAIGLIPVLALPVVLSGPSSLARPYLAVGMAFFASILVATVLAADLDANHSPLDMFRSQWQVPLYAALGAGAATILGGYLRVLGAQAACEGWPICFGIFQQPTNIMVAHLSHRFAVLVAGLSLIYTVVYVWRRHQNRPLLLALTGSAVVLYTTEVLLGRQVAELGTTVSSSVFHLTIATALICTLVAIAVVGYYAPTLPVIAGAEALVMPMVGRPFRAVAKDYLMTTKPRILVLLLITAYAAMCVAAKGLPSLSTSLITMIGLGMSCGAANAINQWYDRDIDVIMKRTQKRPIPAGRLTPAQVLGFAIMTGALSFVLLAFAVNLLTALLAMAGLLFYVGIYTMWLKRSTTQNIVIGGIAGSVPPLVGWAAVTGNLTWAAVLMFMIVFMWTPPHFWALALFRNEDYTKAKIPMLPVVKGERHTKWQILIYSVLLFPTVWSLYWVGAVGQLYLWISLTVTAIYLGANIILFFERLPVQKWAVRSFYWSLLWLTSVFAAMLIDIKR